MKRFGIGMYTFLVLSGCVGLVGAMMQLGAPMYARIAAYLVWNGVVFAFACWHDTGR